MNISRAIILTSLTSVIVLFFGVITSKLIAVFFGPNGIVEYSQFRQIVQWMIILGSFNGSSALIKRIADYKKLFNFSDFISSVFFLYLLGAGLVSLFWFFVIYIIEIPSIRNLFLVSNNPLIFFIVGLFVGVLSSFFLSILSGRQRIFYLCISQIIGGLFGLVTTVFVIYYKLEEYIGIIFLMNLLGSLLSAIIFSIFHRLSYYPNPSNIRYSEVSSFLKFSSVFLITGLVGAAVPILVRMNYIFDYGISSAANFDAAWTISMMYVTLILASMNTFYLPMISSADKEDVKILFNKVFKQIVTLGFLIVCFVVVFKHQLVVILYTSDFSNAVNILKWTTFGDFLKIVSFVFGILLISEEKTKIFIVSEIIFQLTLITLTNLLLPYAENAIGISYCFCNLIYLLFISFYLKRSFNIVLDNGNKRLLYISIIILLIAIIASITEVRVTYGLLLIFCCFSAILFFGFTKSDKKELYKKFSVFLN